MPQTNQKKQASYKKRMSEKGYCRVEEWIPTKDKLALKQLCKAARDDYKAAGEPDSASLQKVTI